VATNSLGGYIIRNKIPSIEIHVMTSIPTPEISRCKNGQTELIAAEKIYLFWLVAKELFDEPLKDFLPKIYPLVNLKNSDKPETINTPMTRTPFGRLLNGLEEHTLHAIAYKTGITIKRLKDLSSKPTAIIWGHELFLIELASDAEFGECFNGLFGNLKLNSLVEREDLREKERLRGSKNTHPM
jgi:hypothetical protein